MTPELPSKEKLMKLAFLAMALLTLVCLMGRPGFGQNVRVDSIAFKSTSIVTVAPGSYVALCIQPCTIPTVVSLGSLPSPLAPLCDSLTDTGCTSPNPVQADALGNYHFYIASGATAYSIVFFGAGVVQQVRPDQTFGVASGGAAIPGAVYATDYNTLQDAIAASGTTGALIIPSTYSGSGTFTNPNNVTVIDLRPGSQSFLNPRTWGATVSGTSNDDTPAWREMIAYAEALPSCLSGTGLQCAAIYVPQGYSTAGCGAPISIQNPGISIIGGGRETSLWGPNGVVSGCSGWFGSWLAVTGTAAQYVTGGVMNFNGTALVSGGGNALQQTSATANNSFINISDCPVCAALNGVAQITVEFWYKPTSITGQQLSSSSGQFGSLDTFHRAYDIYMDGTGQVTALLNVAGSTKTVGSGATLLSAGSTYHIALSYDGSTVRLFINGTSVGTPLSASGTITQKQYESVHIGCDAAADLYDGCGGSGTFEQYGFYGTIDNFRLSNTARYTANFTPTTAKWGTPDSHVLAQLTFQTQFDSLWTQGGNAAVGAPILVNFPIHRNDFCPGGAQTTKITGVGFTLGNEYLNSGIGVTLKDIGVGRVAMNDNGIMVGRGCNFDSSYEDIWFAGGPANNRYSFYVGTGIAHFEKISLNGGPYQFIGPANAAARDFFITMDTNAIAPVVFQGLSGGPSNLLTLDNFQYDSETGASNLVTPLLLDNIQQAVITSSLITNTNGPTSSYPVAVQAPLKRANITFIGDAFATNAGSAARVHMAENGSPQQFPSIPNPPLFFGDFETVSQAVPWSDGPTLILDSKFGSLGAVPYTFNIANDVSTGTYPTLGVKITSTGAVVTGTSDTTVLAGVAMPLDQQQNLSALLTSGTVDVAFGGVAKLTFDGAVTAGHCVIPSTTEGGAFHDNGTSCPAFGKVVGTATESVAVLTVPPAPPCAGQTSGGSMADGTYLVAMTIANIAGGETTVSPDATVTISGGSGAGEINCSALVSVLPGAKWQDGSAGFAVYVSTAGGNDGTRTKQTVNTSTCTGSFGVATVANSGAFCGLNSGYLLKSLASGAAVPGSNTAGAWAKTALALSQPNPPTTYNHSGTLAGNSHLIQDSCVLGTSCAVTLTGSSVFTSSTSYTCVCQDQTAIDACKVAQSSGTAFTITGNATDSIFYSCVGN